MKWMWKISPVRGEKLNELKQEDPTVYQGRYRRRRKYWQIFQAPRIIPACIWLKEQLALREKRAADNQTN